MAKTNAKTPPFRHSVNEPLFTVFKVLHKVKEIFWKVPPVAR